MVRAACSFDPWNLLSASDRGRAEKGPGTLFVSICYQEQPIEPTRPAITDSCGAVGKLHLRQAARCLVPAREHRAAAQGRALRELLRRVRGLLPADRRDQEVRAAWAPDRGVPDRHRGPARGGPARPDGDRRRQLEPRRALHARPGGADPGHQRSPRRARDRFSQPVYAETLLDPVVQIYVTERGRGRSTDVYEMQGTYVEKPKRGLVKSVRYRETTGETLQHGDLVVITLRAPMVLDRCCQPVEGLNVGGRVPLLPEYHEFRSGHEPDVCVSPPFRAGPWITHGPGNFESWFTIANGESK